MKKTYLLLLAIAGSSLLGAGCFSNSVGRDGDAVPLQIEKTQKTTDDDLDKKLEQDEDELVEQEDQAEASDTADQNDVDEAQINEGATTTL
jgi:hypothetical protein